jgi:hydrogenase nickel incorporation protein HypA/HybF
MHEYSLAQSLLRMVEEQARAAGATRVLRVVVRVGGAAGVEPALLETAWGVVRETPVCAASELALDLVPERWVCALCRTPIAAGAELRCGACDVAAVLDGGDELLLARIEVERDGPALRA